MKLITYLITAFLLTTSAWSANFVEAQLAYKKNSAGEKLYQTTWNSERKTLTIEMAFDWRNFSDTWHGKGFEIGSAKKGFLTSPELDSRCRLLDFQGNLSKDGNAGSNFLKIELQGEYCKEIEKAFHLLDASMTFYIVPNAEHNFYTDVVHLIIMDAAPSL